VGGSAGIARLAGGRVQRSLSDARYGACGDLRRADRGSAGLVAIALSAIGSLYLLYWGAVTHDPHPHRPLSIAGGLVGLVPALYAITFALTRTPTEPAP
jgi:hypothetical protein